MLHFGFFNLLGLHFLPFLLVHLDLLCGQVADVCADIGVRSVYTYSGFLLSHLRTRVKLDRTSDNHSSLTFLDLDQPFLSTCLKEHG